MNIELYLAFVVASAVLIIVPGPNVVLIVAHSLSHGAGRARVWLADARRARIRSRITGSILIGAGLGLALARKS